MRLAIAILTLANRIDLGSYFSRLKGLFDVIPGLRLKREGLLFRSICSNRRLFRILIVCHIAPLLVACGKSADPSTVSPASSIICTEYASPYMVQGVLDTDYHKSAISLCTDGVYIVKDLDTGASFKSPNPAIRLPGTPSGWIYTTIADIRGL